MFDKQELQELIDAAIAAHDECVSISKQRRSVRFKRLKNIKTQVSSILSLVRRQATECSSIQYYEYLYPETIEILEDAGFYVGYDEFVVDGIKISW